MNNDERLRLFTAQAIQQLPTPGLLSPIAEDELAQPVKGGGAQQNEMNGQRYSQSQQHVENDIGAEIERAIWTLGLHNASLSSLTVYFKRSCFN